MKVLILGGSGEIGSAVAWDLVRHHDVEAVGIVGRREDALESTKRWIHSKKVITHALDVLNRQAVAELMKQYDVGVLALPDRRTSYALVETAIEAGLDSVDMLEEYHRKPDAHETEGLQLPAGMTLDEYGEWLHEKALERGVILLDGMGFAPGLSNITLGEGIRKMDRARSAIARVGGIPAKEIADRHPLRYMITWAFEHVLREYMVKVKVIKDGKIIEVDALTDHENIHFTQFEKNERLECAITPGMPSFVLTRPELQEFAEKTIRWPGHFQGIQVLKESGLLNLMPVEFQGMHIVPRDFVAAVIGARLKPLEGDTDVCVMWNTVSGTKNGRESRIDYYMWDEADTKTGMSSMARVTGFSAAIGALLIGRREIRQKGIVPPEDCIEGALYKRVLSELKARNIIIREVSSDQSSK
jgi:lysine 6-dehydrogenase